MAVNRELRDRLANALAAFMRGELRSFAFDSVVSNVRSLRAGDEALDGLALSLWFLYDDIADHPICVDRNGWDVARRCLAFLKSDQEALGEGDFAPFLTEEAWDEAECLLAPFGLPEYDATAIKRHERVRSRDFLLRMLVAGVFLALLVWLFRIVLR